VEKVKPLRWFVGLGTSHPLSIMGPREVDDRCDYTWNLRGWKFLRVSDNHGIDSGPVARSVEGSGDILGEGINKSHDEL
jgi:hypothetical protein